MFISLRSLTVAGLGFLLATGLASTASAAAISLNFGTGANGTPPVGSQIAGFVPEGNWNDIPLAQQTNAALKDDSGATVSGFTLSTAETFSFSGSAFTAGGVNFANPGDTTMMTGHIYHGGGAPVDLTFNGSVPYALFDLYIYYNSGAINNTQTLSIPSLGLSEDGSELPGGDTAFVLSTGLNNANYVVFKGLTAASLPSSFIVRAQGSVDRTGGGPYGYINGLQFVSVPEPATLSVLALGGLMLVRRRR
jgi:hypothetical protein